MSDYPKAQPQLRLECEVVGVKMIPREGKAPLCKLTVDVTAQRVRVSDERTVRIPFLLPGLEMLAWQTKTAQDLLPGDKLLCEVVLSVWGKYANLQAKAEDIKIIARAKLPPKEPEAARQDATAPAPLPEPPPAPATRQEPAADDDASDQIPF